MNLPTSWATSLRRALSLTAAGAALLAVPASAQTTYVVDSAADDAVTASSTPDGTLTLREAVIAANTDAAYGDAAAGSGKLTLGELEITDGLTVTGNGTTEVGPQLDMRSRIFVVNTVESVSLATLTLRDGYTLTDNGGALFVAAGGDVAAQDVTFDRSRAVDGGAAYVSGEASLTLDGTTFVGNRATGSAATNGGGAIYTAGAVSSDGLDINSFDDNRATVGSGSGGGVFVADGGSFTGSLAAFSGNRASRAGGAIEVREGGSVDLSSASFITNVAGASPGNGGAIHITGAGSVDLTLCFVNNNVAFSEGGGLWNSSTGTMSLNDVTVDDNIARGAAADNGGGGLFSDGGMTNVVDGSITGNSAIGASGSGGGIFAVGTTSFTVNGTAIRNNTAQRAGGGIEVLDGAMELINIALQSNQVARSPGNGGGLHISGLGAVSMDMSIVSGNRSGNEGGGLWNSGGGSMIVNQTTIDGNVTLGNGGGVYQQAGESGVTVLTNVALTNNSATRLGGGLFAEGATMTVSNSTVSGNAARRGAGGAAEDAMVSFSSSTIAANTASGRGGGFVNPSMGNRVLLQNTIVADNNAGSPAVELSGFYESAGNNIIETLTGAGVKRQPNIGDQFVDPMLGPLADNGGPTMTHALLAGSPAIDAGMTDLVTDQRGEARMDPDDIGAFDFGAMMAGPGAMIFTGVFDGPLSGGTPKVVEFYVTEDIADLGLFGFGSANNGGGTDGEEFSFPDGATATAGDFLYLVASGNEDEFMTYFGFAPDYASGSAGINGDDAVELFLDGAVVDTFGDLDTIGDGEPWDYTDGWAYRMDGTGPDGMMFVVGNWTYSGIDVNDGETDNGTAATPFPIGTYTDAPPSAQNVFSAKTGAATGLAPVAPNPIRQTGRVQFTVAQSEAVTVELYDMMGRRVQSLYSGTPTAETVVDVTIDASALASGVYVVVLSGQTTRETQRVTVAR